MQFELLLAFVASLLTGVTTLGTGEIYQWFIKRFQNNKKTDAENIEQIIAANASLTKLNAPGDPLSYLNFIGRVPTSGLNPKQLSALLRDIKSAIKEAVEVNSKATAAIEGLINNYHAQALGQAKAQFWFSIGAAVVGFIWILVYGISIQPENWITASKILPGIVMESVAFLFFRQASDTRQRATELYDRLRKDKQSTESIALIASIEDMRIRSVVKAQIALHMSGLSPNPIDLKSFLSTEKIVLDESTDIKLN